MVDRDTCPSDVIKSNSPVADSVLCPPASLNAYYHVITRNLGVFFGERDALCGTLFVRHIQMQGGGLCAQACCFMVAGMLTSFITKSPKTVDPGIHGIAEITALASDKDSQRESGSGEEPGQVGLRFNRAGGMPWDGRSSTEHPSAARSDLRVVDRPSPVTITPCFLHNRA